MLRQRSFFVIFHTKTEPLGKNQDIKQSVSASRDTASF